MVQGACSLYCSVMKLEPWRYDITIYPGSLISKIPHAFRPFAIWLRNRRQLQLKRHRYRFDGITSKHNYAFIHSDKFVAAHKKAVEKCGFDYRIYGRQHQAIWAAEIAISRFPNGSFVEFGTARGYMLLTILGALTYSNYDLSNLKIYCFDTFLPYSLDPRGMQNLGNGVNFYYADSFQRTKLAFASFSQVELVKGQLPDSLDKVEIEQVSFLHIDLNNPKVEIMSLERIWKKIPRGGMILIDDYAYSRYEETTRIFDRFASDYGQLILTTAFGPGLIIKT